MDRAAASEQIREACRQIAQQLMRIHPAVPGLNDKTAQDEMYQALFNITKDLETIKKRLGKLEKTEAED